MTRRPRATGTQTRRRQLCVRKTVPGCDDRLAAPTTSILRLGPTEGANIARTRCRDAVRHIRGARGGWHAREFERTGATRRCGASRTRCRRREWRDARSGALRISISRTTSSPGMRRRDRGNADAPGNALDSSTTPMQRLKMSRAASASRGRAVARGAHADARDRDADAFRFRAPAATTSSRLDTLLGVRARARSRDPSPARRDPAPRVVAFGRTFVAPKRDAATRERALASASHALASSPPGRRTGDGPKPNPARVPPRDPRTSPGRTATTPIDSTPPQSPSRPPWVGANGIPSPSPSSDSRLFELSDDDDRVEPTPPRVSSDRDRDRDRDRDGSSSPSSEEGSLDRVVAAALASATPSPSPATTRRPLSSSPPRRSPGYRSTYLRPSRSSEGGVPEPRVVALAPRPSPSPSPSPARRSRSGGGGFTIGNSVRTPRKPPIVESSPSPSHPAVRARPDAPRSPPELAPTRRNATLAPSPSRRESGSGSGRARDSKLARRSDAPDATPPPAPFRIASRIGAFASGPERDLALVETIRARGSADLAGDLRSARGSGSGSGSVFDSGSSLSDASPARSVPTSSPSRRVSFAPASVSVSASAFASPPTRAIRAAARLAGRGDLDDFDSTITPPGTPDSAASAAAAAGSAAKAAAAAARRRSAFAAAVTRDAMSPPSPRAEYLAARRRAELLHAAVEAAAPPPAGSSPVRRNTTRAPSPSSLLEEDAATARAARELRRISAALGEPIDEGASRDAARKLATAARRAEAAAARRVAADEARRRRRDAAHARKAEYRDVRARLRSWRASASKIALVRSLARAWRRRAKSRAAESARKERLATRIARRREYRLVERCVIRWRDAAAASAGARVMAETRAFAATRRTCARCLAAWCERVDAARLRRRVVDGRRRAVFRAWAALLRAIRFRERAGTLAARRVARRVLVAWRVVMTVSSFRDARRARRYVRGWRFAAASSRSSRRRVYDAIRARRRERIARSFNAWASFPRWRPAFTRDALRELAAEVRLRRALVTRRRRRVARRALASWRDAVRDAHVAALGHWAYRAASRAIREWWATAAANGRARARRRTADAFARVVAHQRAIASAVAAGVSRDAFVERGTLTPEPLRREWKKKKRGTGGGKGGGTGGGKGNQRGDQRGDRGTHRGTGTYPDPDPNPDPNPDRSLPSFPSSSGLARRARKLGRAADRAVAFVREDPTTPRKTAERVGASAFMRRRTGGDDEGAGVGSRGARSWDGFAGFGVRGDEKTSYASPNATRIRTSPELASLRDLAPTLWRVASVGNVEAEDERPEDERPEDERPEDERTATSGSGSGSDSRTAPISSAAEALTIARRRRTRTRAEAMKAAAVIMASSSESEWEEAEPDPRGAFGSPEAA